MEYSDYLALLIWHERCSCQIEALSGYCLDGMTFILFRIAFPLAFAQHSGEASPKYQDGPEDSGCL